MGSMMVYTILTYISNGQIIAFGVCHVECKGIPHDHVVCFLSMRNAILTMWYAF